MLHIGIDEAGYGPLLGPLVVGASAFRLADVTDPDEVNLRARLRGLVIRRSRRRPGSEPPVPVPVDDSKRIHSRYGLAGLARGFGAFAAAMDCPPPVDLHDLLRRFCDRQPEDFQALPWYRDLEEAKMPPYAWPGPWAPRFARRGVHPLDLRVLPLAARHLNDLLADQVSKARVLGVVTGTCLLSILDRYPAEDAEVVIDRQGGRRHYESWLADVLPFATITRGAGRPGEVRYRVALPDRRLEVRFLTEGDRRSLAVGWASIAAKLTRELFMDRLNAWFASRSPSLRPTAGYHLDGRRFLRDVQTVIGSQRVDLRDLVRQR